MENRSQINGQPEHTQWKTITKSMANRSQINGQPKQNQRNAEAKSMESWCQINGRPKLNQWKTEAKTMKQNKATSMEKQRESKDSRSNINGKANQNGRKTKAKWKENQKNFPHVLRFHKQEREKIAEQLSSHTSLSPQQQKRALEFVFGTAMPDPTGHASFSTRDLFLLMARKTKTGRGVV